MTCIPWSDSSLMSTAPCPLDDLTVARDHLTGDDHHRGFEGGILEADLADGARGVMQPRPGDGSRSCQLSG